MRSIVFFLLFILVFIFFYACDDTADCGYDTNRKVKIAFVNKVKDKYVDTTVAGLSIKNLKDTFFYTNNAGYLFGLQLSQHSDTSTFVFLFDSIANLTGVDTVNFITTRQLEMISSDCGFNTRFTIDSIVYTKNKISEIDIIEPAIDKDLDMGRNCRLILKKGNALE